MVNRMKPILAGALIATAASFSAAQVASAEVDGVRRMEACEMSRKQRVLRQALHWELGVWV